MNASYLGTHRSLILGLALATIVGCSSNDSNDDQSTTPTLPPEPTTSVVQLRVLETTDVHANVMNYNYYSDQEDNAVGLVKTASLIELARQEVQNSILVDNGDLIQGSPLGDFYAKQKGLENNEVHPIYKAMNLMDYDVANIGNHEFNFGLPYLKEAIDDANFPYICANIFFEDHDDNEENDVPYFEPYLIQTKNVVDESGAAHELKIGYIGFVTPQIMQWDKSNLEGKIKAKDIVEMANKYIPMMKEEGADIIIAVPHSGLTADDRKGNDEHATFYLTEVQDIDAILFGHAHRVFPGDASYNDIEGVDNVAGKIKGIPAVMPGYWGNNLGFIDLTLSKTGDEAWKVTNSQSVIRPIYERGENRTVISLVEAHQGIVEAVTEDHDEVRDWVSTPFAKISAPINSFFALVQDDPSIQVVTDAQLDYVERIVRGTEYADMSFLSVGAPFRAGRGGPDDFTNLAAGDVAYGNVADLYIYPNTLKVLKLTGAEVKEWLEMSAGQFNQINPGSTGEQLINTDFPSYNFDVIDGITYEIDVTQPARYSAKGELANADANRVVNIMFEGEPLDLAKEFLVISNNYRASGGGNFPGITSEKIVIDAPDENRQAVADYLINETYRNPDTGFDPSADGNWKFASIPNTVVTFAGSPLDTAREFANQLPAVEFSSIGEDGFGHYTLDLSL